MPKDTKQTETERLVEAGWLPQPLPTGVKGVSAKNPLGRPSLDRGALQRFAESPPEARLKTLQDEWSQLGYLLLMKAKRLAMSGEKAAISYILQLSKAAAIATEKLADGVQPQLPRNLVVQLFGGLSTAELTRVVAPATPVIDVNVEGTHTSIEMTQKPTWLSENASQNQPRSTPTPSEASISETPRKTSKPEKPGSPKIVCISPAYESDSVPRG